MARYKSPHDKSSYVPLTDAGHPRCQAYARTHDGQCKNVAMVGATMCRMHGGKVQAKANGVTFKHGKYAKRFKGRLAEAYREMRSDPDIGTVDDELAALRTLAAAGIEQIEAGGTLDQKVIFDWLTRISEVVERYHRIKQRHALTPAELRMFLDVVASVLGEYVATENLDQALAALEARLGPFGQIPVE